MSATSNLFHNLEHDLGRLRGEREAAAEELAAIEASLTRMSDLHTQIVALDKAIEAAETLLVYHRPEWTSDRVKPARPRVWKGPFKSGEIGTTALGLLREVDDWLRPIEVARMMLAQIGADPDDRKQREKLTNSIGSYLRSHEGDLVESQGEYAKEWRVIRPDRGDGPRLNS